MKVSGEDSRIRGEKGTIDNDLFFVEPQHRAIPPVAFSLSWLVMSVSHGHCHIIVFLFKTETDPQAVGSVGTHTSPESSRMFYTVMKV